MPTNDTPTPQETMEKVITERDELIHTLYEYIRSLSVPEPSMGTPAHPNLNVYRFHGKTHELLDRSLTTITVLSLELKRKEKRIEELEEALKEAGRQFAVIDSDLKAGWNMDDLEKWQESVLGLVGGGLYVTNKALPPPPTNDE